jgi:hypothetical protein
MPITDIKIQFQNYLQDMGSKFDNACYIYYDNGTMQPADSSMNIEWQWAVIMPNDSGQWVKTVIDTTFNLKIAPNANQLHNGEFLMELRARDMVTGKTWANTIPCFLQHELVFGEYPNYMPDPLIFDAPTYREWFYTNLSLGPHIPGSHFIANKPGDMNGDGVVNTGDLILFNSKFGSP